MSNEKVQINIDYLGEGDTLYSVSLTGKDWDGMAVWLVAADSEESAIKTTHAQYDMEEDAPDQWYAQEIGRIL